ncbi:hypothetical protein PF001_g20122 [Phytophthora fragariae]|uniref:PiggyBac transposable element-derived protein domain-containing protein n=2 Tax=Phytophthora fragariae TaxID=53985 RepID=A0A6A3SHH5_9STRA|nr:hypothetical protein PF003_g27653 [Phytophthora fragariae]KAE9112214.1 hypothetical protein PF006_g20028 [Phytophthora fragariae]KAE9289268.1 hypothetical protein PF001_g20122 [Phytophthora fragariae]
MNGVDRVDQLRSTNPTRRKEQRLSMSLLTWVLDLSIINGFALMKEIETGPAAPRTLREFKRRVCESLVQGAMTKRRDAQLKRGRPDSLVNSTDEERAPHVLTPNSRENSRGKLV